MYRFRATAAPDRKARAQLFGSGAILPEVIKAQEILEAKYDVGADVWSVTSYSELYREGHACERWNMLHPGGAAARPIRHAVPEGRAGRAGGGVRLRQGAARLDRQWLPRPLNDARHRRFRPQREPRDACAISSRSTTATSSSPRWPRWPATGRIERSVVQQAIKTHNINPEKRIRRYRSSFLRVRRLRGSWS